MPKNSRTLATRICLGFCLAACLGASACRTSPMGKTSKSLVHLYDNALPDGMIEIELDRSGKIYEMEADYAVSDLPLSVLQAAREYLPDGVFTGAEREHNLDGKFWEVKMRQGHRDWELVIDSQARIREIEMSLLRSEAPPAVIEAADDFMIGSAFISVEKIQRGDSVRYHVKKQMHGASYKMVVRHNGQIDRVVREARAEIEIPLAL